MLYFTVSFFFFLFCFSGKNDACFTKVVVTEGAAQWCSGKILFTSLRIAMCEVQMSDQTFCLSGCETCHSSSLDLHFWLSWSQTLNLPPSSRPATSWVDWLFSFEFSWSGGGGGRGPHTHTHGQTQCGGIRCFRLDINRVYMVDGQGNGIHCGS